MRRRKQADWVSLGWDAWRVGLDSAAVMGLRTAKFVACDAAAAVEAQRMVSEKVAAAVELQLLALGGGLGTSPRQAVKRSLRHYGPKVRANRRRLSKK
jgi:hypothetical protein